MPHALRAALVAYRDRLDAIFGARLCELRLFGSFARGEADEDSDVDVLVLVDGLRDVEIGRVSEEGARVAIATGLPLAPLPMATERFRAQETEGRALARVIGVEGIPL